MHGLPALVSKRDTGVFDVNDRAVTADELFFAQRSFDALFLGLESALPGQVAVIRVDEIEDGDINEVLGPGYSEELLADGIDVEEAIVAVDGNSDGRTFY